MGRHDEKAMSAPQVRTAFERFVTLEQDLVALLQNKMEQHRTMLGAVGGR